MDLVQLMTTTILMTKKLMIDIFHYILFSLHY
jgi:hypothetical protein